MVARVSQDLSVAGKRAGIHDGARSNLFFQAIRIIKEMRDATNGKYPRFAVWENVAGAFTSQQGEDFRCVLEEFCKICGDYAIPRPENGKWKHAGEIVGDNFSVAWRLLDAQYWGVPQRRKRIYLVADFAGQSAGKILFEREGLPRDYKTSGKSREGVTRDAENSTDRGDSLKCLNPQDGQRSRLYDANGVWSTLSAAQGGNNQAIVYALDAVNSNSMKSDNPNSGFHEEQIIKTLQTGGVNPTCNQGGNVVVQEVYPTTARTLAARADSSPCVDRGQNVVCYALQGNGIGRSDDAGCAGCGWHEDVGYTLNTVDKQAVAYTMTTGSYVEVVEGGGQAH